MTSYLDSIERDDLPPKLLPLADLIGMPAMRQVLETLKGHRFYIPDPASLTPAVRRYARRCFHVEPSGATNITELAREANVSPRHIENLVYDPRPTGQPPRP